MDPYIAFPDGHKARLSAIKASRESRAHWLARHHGNDGNLCCLCREEGIPLGVARRTVPSETFYFYPLHRLDPSRHAHGCPHRIGPDTGTPRTENVPAIEERDGKLNVNLASPAYRGTTHDGDDGGTPEDHGDATRRVMHGRLLTLLELMWSEAQLNVWRPYFEGKRFYGMVSHRLQKLADRLQVKGWNLAPLFYIAPPFHPGDEVKAELRVQTLMEHLAPQTDGKRYYGYVIGLVKKTEPMDKAVVFKLAHTRLRVWCGQERWESLARRWFNNRGPEQVPGDNPCIALFRVERHDGKNGPWLSLEDFACMHLSDTHSWIPVDSSHERQVTLALIKEKRHFRKPLHVELGEEDELLPDFVLEDRPDRPYLEILGRMEDPTYRQHWVLKLAKYQSLGQPLWIWDPETMKDLPAFPPQQLPPKTAANQPELHANS